MTSTLSITELQKSPKKAFAKKGLTYVLSNNEPRGAIIDKDLLQFIEEKGVLQLYEDIMDAQNLELNKRSQEVQRIYQDKKEDELLSFNQVFS